MRSHAMITILLLTTAPAASAGMIATTKIDQEYTFSGDLGTNTFTFERAAVMSPSPSDSLLRVELALGMIVSGGSLWVDNDGPLPGHVDVRYVARATTASDDIPIGALISQVANADTLFLDGDNEHTGGPPIFSAQGDDDEGVLLPIDGAIDLATVELNPLFNFIFEGTDTFEMSVNVDTSFLITGLPSVAGSFGGITVEQVTLRVSYFYTPAPSALAVFALGGCALTRRRRR